MVVTVVLLTLLAVASATDMLRHKIYNATTYPGIVAAVLFNAIGDGVVRWRGAELGKSLKALGWLGELPAIDGLWRSAIGFALCGAVMLACFVCFKVGGGDVKLLAMLGAFLGPERGLEAMLWTFVLGACMAMVVLIWRVGPWRLAARVFRQVLWSLRLGQWSPLSAQERADLQPPLFLAPSALAAVVLVQFHLVVVSG